MYKGMGFGGGMNMQQLMKQAQKMQADMQAKMEAAEEELESAEITTSSGGGMVEVTCSGKKKISAIKIHQPTYLYSTEISASHRK